MTTGIMVVSMIPSDIRNATRNATGLLKLTGNGAARVAAAACRSASSGVGVTVAASGTSGSKTGRPHIWQNRARSASLAPQVQYSGVT